MIAFVFPGQGAQYAGMGAELARAYPEARTVFERADAILGMSLSALCWEGPDERLKETEVTQPAILTTSIAALAFAGLGNSRSMRAHSSAIERRAASMPTPGRSRAGA